MSDFFAPLLMSLCAGTIGTYNNACHKALEAGYVQSGYQAQVSTVQGQLATFGKTKEHEILGKNEAIVNGLVATGVVVKEKKVDLTLPTLGVCDRFSTQLQQDKYGLKLEWRW